MPIIDGIEYATVHEYFAHGGAAEYFECNDVEVLCESGAGTGKTRSLLERAYTIAMNYPGSRQFFTRKTHKDLADTVLPEWETEVLGRGHVAIHGDAKPLGRKDYRFPNGSTIDLFGLSNADSRMSGQWHRGYVFEGHEAERDDWEKLLTRMRSPPIKSIDTGELLTPQLTMDTNPARKSHWANKRAEQPYIVPESLKDMLPPARPGQKQMTRIMYRHEDNPRWYDHEKRKWRPEGAQYFMILNGLTGARRARLVYHRWVSEEGLVWPEFSKSIHMPKGELEVVTFEGGAKQYWVRVDSWIEPDGKPYRQRVARFIGGMDWGRTAAGAFGVVAVTADRLKVMVREVYFTGKSLDWWAEVAVKAQDDYGLDLIAADPSRNDCIEIFNMRMGARRGRDGAAICRGANNQRNTARDLGGLDCVREALRPANEPRPKLIWLADRFSDGVDKVLRDETKKPWCSTEEIEDYLWKKSEDDTPAKDETDPNCEDHGCDMVRYLCVAEWEFGSLTVPPNQPTTYQPGQIGYLFPPPHVRNREKAKRRSPFMRR